MADAVILPKLGQTVEESTIVRWCKAQGDKVEKGERIGLIKFGSRMDIIFGPEWEIVVREGQRVSAGSSILAKRRDTQDA